jgi:transposase
MTDREASLEAELKAARIEVDLLKQKVDALVRMLYRPKSEKFDPNQLMLLEEPESKKDDAPVAGTELLAGATKPPRKVRVSPSRPRIPEHLPVREEVIDPEEVKACPQKWRLIGEEVTERLDYRPAQFLKHRLIRRKFVPLDAPFTAPVIAPLPACLQERCLATPELITQVVISKYVDHLPLYRQEQIYRTRHSVEIPRQTLCRWVELAAWWFEPIYREMIRLQNTRNYLQIDETPIRYLQPGAGKCAQGYFWVTSVPAGDAIYHWYPGRGAKYLDQIFDQDFSGNLQCDAYSAYTSFQKQRAGPIELSGCWAHVRRKFYEALTLAPATAGWILRQIGQLYLIERRLREHCASPSLREAVRQSESAAIVRRIKKALFLLKSRYLPKNTMGKAISYALSNWTDLQVYLCNGIIEIDNNLVENAIRPTKLGAKNWLFIGSEGSGKTSAIIFTLVESAKRHGLEPHAYLQELLRRLPQASNLQIANLTPEAMAKAKAKERSVA